jgi:adenylate cyclase
MLRFLRLPNRIPVGLPKLQANQKLLAAFVIAVCATGIAYAVRNTDAIDRLRFALYDEAYTLRESSDRKGGPVVIIAVDEHSLTEMDRGVPYGKPVRWPWPREIYGDLIEYLQKCGAKVVAFDMLFNQSDRQADYGSDQNFADVVNATPLKVIFGKLILQDGTSAPFAPPVTNPIFGVVNASGGVFRVFEPIFQGKPSLAYQAAELYTGRPPTWRDPFFVHFYGKRVRQDGQTTFRYVDAVEALAAAQGQNVGLDPNTFKDKIVLVGSTAAGLYDAKATPLEKNYPGVEWQATAIENLLFGQRVKPVREWVALLDTFLGALMASLGAVMPQRASLKAGAMTLSLLIVSLLSLLLFLGEPIHWLPLAVPLTALVLSAVASITWSYFTEGRQRLFISKAFALSTSPVIAEAISKNPDKLNLGGERREITVMFTDLAGFTDISETMEVVKLAQVINIYMEAMSEEIVTRDGYLDKYIGDAIMSFWNGLVDQPDHAARACRAALAIKRREVEIAPDLQQLVDAKIITRIGVNTGPMAVGNLGSSRKLAYTVLGDAVNLGARLEPANKLYDTEVIISQATASQLNGQFVLRELDLLAVKGKTIPMAVYELIAEGQPTPDVKAKLDLYAAGLTHYRAQRWDDAEASWTRLLKDFPEDGPAHKMLARVAKLRHESLPADWDGVYRSKEK